METGHSRMLLLLLLLLVKEKMEMEKERERKRKKKRKLLVQLIAFVVHNVGNLHTAASPPSFCCLG